MPQGVGGGGGGVRYQGWGIMPYVVGCVECATAAGFAMWFRCRVEVENGLDVG